MPESSVEMFDRVRLMARPDTDWDLSDNDTAALRHVLAAAEAREAAQPTAAEVIAAAERALRCGKWESFTRDEREMLAAALALIARWKEADGGE